MRILVLIIFASNDDPLIGPCLFDCPHFSLQIPEVMKKDCLLFYYPDCKGLASRIAEVGGGNVELAEINWRQVFLCQSS